MRPRCNQGRIIFAKYWTFKTVDHKRINKKFQSLLFFILQLDIEIQGVDSKKLVINADP